MPTEILPRPDQPRPTSAQRPPDLQGRSTSPVPLVLHGVVQHGREMGRRRGFPTANLHDVTSVPRDGIYAGTVRAVSAAAEPVFVAIISVGRRSPHGTEEGLRLAEVHLLGFSGDLYGHTLHVELRARLRSHRRFANSAEHIRQLGLDVEATERWAHAEGLDELLRADHAGEERWHAARWGVSQRCRTRTHTDVVRRSLKRAQRIADAVQEASPAELSHDWIAERAHLPVEYVRWCHPDLRALLSEAPTGATTRPG